MMNRWNKWTEKQRRDWIRASHNLPPAPMDWEDKVVIVGCILVSVASLVILACGG